MADLPGERTGEEGLVALTAASSVSILAFFGGSPTPLTFSFSFFSPTIPKMPLRFAGPGLRFSPSFGAFWMASPPSFGSPKVGTCSSSSTSMESISSASK